MSLTDSIIEGTTAFLVRTLLRPKVYFENPENRVKKLQEPCVVVVNHTSHLDGPVLNTVFRRNRMHSLAAKDRFYQKGFGFFLRHTGCIPIDRQSPDLTWVHQSLDVLHKQHENIVIYPEGRHGSHRQQLPFHSGVVMLAALAQVPIVMVYIDGPHYVARKRSKLIVSEPFRLTAPTAGINEDYVNAQTEFLQEKMKSLMELFIKMNDGI
jgi:1-acyl-sn-glycerol-3-phosphate acyltransferase